MGFIHKLVRAVSIFIQFFKDVGNGVVVYEIDNLHSSSSLEPVPQIRPLKRENEDKNAARTKLLHKMQRKDDGELIDVAQCTEREKTAIRVLFLSLKRVGMTAEEAHAMVRYVLSHPPKIPQLLKIFAGYDDYETITAFKYDGETHLKNLEHHLHLLLPLTPELNDVIQTVSETNLIHKENASSRAIHENGAMLGEDIIPKEMMVFGRERQQQRLIHNPPSPSLEDDTENAPLLPERGPKKKKKHKVALQSEAHD